MSACHSGKPQISISFALFYAFRVISILRQVQSITPKMTLNTTKVKVPHIRYKIPNFTLCDSMASRFFLVTGYVQTSALNDLK